MEPKTSGMWTLADTVQWVLMRRRRLVAMPPRGVDIPGPLTSPIGAVPQPVGQEV